MTSSSSSSAEEPNLGVKYYRKNEHSLAKNLCKDEKSRSQSVRCPNNCDNSTTIGQRNPDAEDDELINIKLPREIMLKILSYLDLVSLCRCAQVSTEWNSLANDRSNWHNIDLFNFQLDVEAKLLLHITNRWGSSLKRLSLRGCRAVDDASVQTLVSTAGRLEVLNLSGCTMITDETLKCLGAHCFKLSELNFESCKLITDKGIGDLILGCHYLKKINVSWCTEITTAGFQKIFSSFRHLTSFTAKGCYNFKPQDVIFMADHCPDVVVANFMNCQDIDDNAIKHLAQKCRNLKHLSLSGCFNISDNCLEDLGRHCQQIVSLEVAGCSNLTDFGLDRFISKNQFLEKLDLEDCEEVDDITLKNLAEHCPRLEILSLSHCKKISNEGLKYLSEGKFAAANFKVLELDNLPNITDQSVEYLKSLKHLRRIDLYDCSRITDRGIYKLRRYLPNSKVHAYFAPNLWDHVSNEDPSNGGGGGVGGGGNGAGANGRYGRCCILL